MILAYWQQRSRNKRQQNQTFMNETRDFELLLIESRSSVFGFPEKLLPDTGPVYLKNRLKKEIQHRKLDPAVAVRAGEMIPEVGGGGTRPWGGPEENVECRIFSKF